MKSPFFRLRQSVRLTLVLAGIFGLGALGIAGQQDQLDRNRCGSALQTTMGTAETAKLDTVLGNPENYFGKTVTVEGEMHRTFSDRVFSIEDDDFLRDDDLLIITTASKSEVVTPVKDSIEEGEDVLVTGVIHPFNRSQLECMYGPLQIESRASHYKEGDAVMIIDRTTVASAAESELREKPVELPDEDVEPIAEPIAGELESQPESEPAAVEMETEPEAAPEEELPATAGGLPLLALGGALSLLAGFGLRRYQR